MTIGNGAIQVVPARAAAVATIAAGVASLWGVTLNGVAVLISINSNGSVSQTTPGGVVTAVAVAGTVTTSARCTIWRGTHVLVLDPTNGYFSWDGTTWVVIDAARTGGAIAVFQGRAWFASGRTITFTAPNTYTDFAAGNGAGSTVLTDEAFQGNITAMTSAVEQLWVLGQGAIEAIANVQSTGTAPNVTTTFSVTNIVTNLGTNAPASVIGYFRALALLAPFGVYALAGVTPQKLSDKLDGLFPDLTLTPDVPAAVGVVQNLLVLMFLVTYNGSLAQGGAAPIPMLLCFTQGKWFLGVQGTSLSWITSLLVSGVAQAWGTDGTTIYRLFGASASTAVAYKVMSKLYDFGLATTAKAVTKAGLEIQASATVAPTMTIDSEFQAQTVDVLAGNEITLLNAVGATLQLQNSVPANLTLITQGMVLSRQTASMFGRYLGFSIAGSDPPYRIQAVQLELAETRQWSTP